MAAIKTRRLKNPPSPGLRRAGADFEVDFFFIGGSGVVPLSGKPETVIAMVGETRKPCQHFFEIF
jgi:hypothetical protein